METHALVTIAPERVGAVWSAFFSNAAKTNQLDAMTMLFDAVYDADIAAAQKLLANGLSPDQRNEEKQTPLHIAYAVASAALVYSGKLGVLKDSWTWFACFANTWSTLKLAMATVLVAALLVLPILLTGQTPTFVACRRGQLKVVRFLLESAAEVSTSNEDGRTLVHAAALSGSLPCLQLVLEYGGDPFEVDAHGETPYEMLLELGDEASVPLLDFLDSQCSLRQPWIKGKATSLLGLDQRQIPDGNANEHEETLSPSKPPTDEEVASFMAYRKLVPPSHVVEAMHTLEYDKNAPVTIPPDVKIALVKRSSSNQYALATDAKSLHEKQKSSARYLLGPTLVANGAPRTDVVVDQAAHRAAYEWRFNCDNCSGAIIGARFACDEDDNYDLCGACIGLASELKPGCSFGEVPIPEKLPPREKNLVDTAVALGNPKHVLLYFSAKSCAPCRAFTPYLAEYRAHLRSALDFEIVLVSADDDESNFLAAFDEMPWFALPFVDRTRQHALLHKFEVPGFPTLVVLDAAGQLVARNVQDKVWTDPEGTAFPYAPRSLAQLLGDVLVRRDGSVVQYADLAAKVILLYFSAAWCGPSKGFTPLLEAAFSSALAKGHDVEVVYVSADESVEDFNLNEETTPWVTLPFETAVAALPELGEMYSVEGLPHVVVLGPETAHSRPVLNQSAHAAIASDPAGNNFPWPPVVVVDIAISTKSNGFSINHKPALVSYCGSLNANELEAHEADLRLLASEVGKSAGCCSGHCSVSDEPSVIFFTSKSAVNNFYGDEIRRMAGVDADDLVPQAILVDLKNGRVHVHKGLDLVSLRYVLQGFQEHTLVLHPINQ
ncbi:thioredoxin [Achlya hypogyna]|uniref:Thioredoxin n=1 Tax=Achlya hypogyna TaxID=1202772 RepID=A0A1V9ZLY8_ACHHY|nr:thioredoxin [Achlya hypogyna]